jgi:hypothetical protein
LTKPPLGSMLECKKFFTDRSRSFIHPMQMPKRDPNFKGDSEQKCDPEQKGDIKCVMERSCVKYCDEGQCLGSISQIRSYPLVPHLPSRKKTFIGGSDHVILQFQSRGLDFYPFVYDRERKEYRRALLSDSGSFYLACLPESVFPQGPKTIIEREYYAQIQRSFLCRDLGTYYLSPNDQPLTINEERLNMLTQ